VKLLFYEREVSMQAPRKELVPEAKLPKRRRAQRRDARRLLSLPQNPTGVDDVLEALALIDLDGRHWAAGRVEYRNSTKAALRNALAALTRLKEAYAQLPDEYVRARALDVYSINWHQLRKHATAFEQDLKAKPKDPFKYVVHRKWFAARVALQLMHDHGLPTGAEREGKVLQTGVDPLRRSKGRLVRSMLHCAEQERTGSRPYERPRGTMTNPEGSV
jgi:hypothetical protein